MFSALFSFIGGSAFRMIWGEISAYYTKKQDHQYELERLKLQEEHDANQHSRNLEAVKYQAEMGVKVIEVQRDADVARIDAQAWANVVDSTTRITGIKFIDYWNQSIRPLLATLAIFVVVAEAIALGFVLTDWTRELVGAILGIYLADRALSKRGK